MKMKKKTTKPERDKHGHFKEVDVYFGLHVPKSVYLAVVAKAKAQCPGVFIKDVIAFILRQYAEGEINVKIEKD
jgi:hypothetical protein